MPEIFHHIKLGEKKKSQQPKSEIRALTLCLGQRPQEEKRPAMVQELEAQGETALCPCLMELSHVTLKWGPRAHNGMHLSLYGHLESGTPCYQGCVPGGDRSLGQGGGQPGKYFRVTKSPDFRVLMDNMELLLCPQPQDMQRRRMPFCQMRGPHGNESSEKSSTVWKSLPSLPPASSFHPSDLQLQAQTSVWP